MLQWSRALASAEDPSGTLLVHRLRKLQWSRALASAEDQDYWQLNGLGLSPSQEPRPCERGRPTWAPPWRSGRTSLQWSRALASAEDRCCQERRSGCCTTSMEPRPCERGRPP